MPLRALISAVLVLLLAAPAAGAAVPRSAARAVLGACERGDEEADRAAVFEGQMRRLPGSARMQMRFTLQARIPDSLRWRAVAAPGFGTWVSSAPGTSRYVYTKRVEALLAPADYRVQLRFRWLKDDGRVLTGTRRLSRACKQPDPRPNLVVTSLSVQPAAKAGRFRYVAFVRNTGRSAAAGTALRVALDGTALPLTTVAPLEPGEGMLVAAEGPACTVATPIDADADASEAVDERDEADNRFTRLCPPPS